MAWRSFIGERVFDGSAYGRRDVEFVRQISGAGVFADTGARKIGLYAIGLQLCRDGVVRAIAVLEVVLNARGSGNARTVDNLQCLVAGRVGPITFRCADNRLGYIVPVDIDNGAVVLPAEIGLPHSV